MAEDDAAVQAEALRVQEATRRRWVGACGIPWKFSTATFETWAPRSGSIEKAADACREYAEAFPLSGYDSHGWHSLGLFSNGNGLGKTFLVAAIANRLIQRWAGVPGDPCPVMYETGTGLLRRIRGSYNLPAGSSRDRHMDTPIRHTGASCQNGVALYPAPHVGGPGVDSSSNVYPTSPT